MAVKCCVCEKVENFYEAEKGRLYQKEDKTLDVEMYEDNTRTEAFDNVSFDLDDGFYMGFVCGDECKDKFEVAPVGFLDGMTLVVGYQEQSDKTYDFS